MDKPAANRVATVRQAIRQAIIRVIEGVGARLLNLPHDSSGFDRIENAYVEPRPVLRTATARTVPNVGHAIHNT